jgi:hypothetical protein
MDSLDMVEFSMSLEKKYKMTVPDSFHANELTYGFIKAFVTDKPDKNYACRCTNKFRCKFKDDKHCKWNTALSCDYAERSR